MLVGCLPAAMTMVLLRLALPAYAWLDASLLAAALLLPLLALPRYWRQRESTVRLAAEIDRSSEARGLAMALADLPTEARPPGWRRRLDMRLAGYRAPALALQPLGPALIAIACLLAAWILPQSQLPPPAIPNPVADLFAPTDEQLTTFEEEALMPPEELDERQEQLQELREQAETEGMDQQHWQALDGLVQDLDRRAQAVARRLAQAMHSAERLAAQQQPGREALGELAAQLAAMSAGSPGLTPRDSAQAEALLQEALRQGALGQRQLEALRQAGMCRNLGQGSGLSAEQMRAAAEQLAGQLAERRAAIARLKAGLVFDQQLAGLRAGSGGVNRGPGHAELSLSHDGEDDGRGGIEQLQAEAVLNPDGSVTIGEQVREAELDEAVARELRRAAGRRFGSTAAEAQRAEVATRHRATVGRYFQAAEAAPSAPPPAEAGQQPRHLIDPLSMP